MVFLAILKWVLRYQIVRRLLPYGVCRTFTIKVGHGRISTGVGYFWIFVRNGGYYVFFLRVT